MSIPTIYDNYNDFMALFRLYRLLNRSELEVFLDFHNCRFLAHSGVAFLGGLVRQIESRRGKVIFDWDSLQPRILDSLIKNDFTYAFKYMYSPNSGISVPYREYQSKSEKDIICQQLLERWIGAGFLHISSMLQGLIIGNVWEIFDNAFEHSESRIGVFSCGQYYPNMKLLKLTVVDFGIGIPGSVRRFKGKQTYLPETCMKWAFSEGRTTTSGIGRGMGLDLLRDFIKKNQGNLEIFSHEGYTKITDKEDIYSRVNTYFDGTLVNITLNADSNYYMLENEVPSGVVF